MSPTTSACSFSISEELVPSPTAQPSSNTTSLDFCGLLNPPLVLREDRKEVGSQLWPAGMVLAQYLLRCQMDALQRKTMCVSPPQNRGYCCYNSWIGQSLNLQPGDLLLTVSKLSVELGAGSGLVGYSSLINALSFLVILWC